MKTRTEFEAELSDAFAARAARVPVVAASRLRSVDYRPRERGLRAPATVSAGVLAGAAAAGTVLAVVLGGGAPAYAGWSATPTSGSSTASASACVSQLASMRSGPGGTSAGSGAWDNVLTDVRGPFTVALFQDDGADAACFTSSSFTEVNQISSGAASSSVHVQGGGSAAGTAEGAPSRVGVSVSGTGSGSLQQVMQSHLTTADDGPYTLVDGRTQSGVTGVTLVLDDGQDVVATVADGWFVAWWPGSANATSTQVTTASGTTTEPLVLRSLPTPPPLSNSASGNSGAGNTGSGNSGAGSSGGAGPTNP